MKLGFGSYLENFVPFDLIKGTQEDFLWEKVSPRSARSCQPHNRPHPRHRVPRQQQPLPPVGRRGQRQRRRLLSSTVFTHRHQSIVDSKASG